MNEATLRLNKNKIDLVATDPLFTSDIDGAPVPDDWLLYQRFGNNYDRYLEGLQDGHFTSRINTRVRAILGRGIRVIPASKRRADRKAAEGIATMIKARPSQLGDSFLLAQGNGNVCPEKIAYDTVTSMIAWGIAFGHSVLLNDLKLSNGLVVPTNFRALDRNRSYFYPIGSDKTAPVLTDETLKEDRLLISSGYEVRVRTIRAPLSGERVPKGRGIHFSYGSPNQVPWGIGLIAPCWRWIAIKKQAPKELLLHAMKGGSPGVTGYSPNANDISDDGLATKATLNTFLQLISPGAYYQKATPDDEIKLLNSAVNPKIHNLLIDISNREISEVILGDQTYAEKDHGSRAAGESQVADRNLTITDSDCSLIDEAMQSCLWDEISRINFPKANPPQIRRETYAERLEREEEAKTQDRQVASREKRTNSDRTLFIDMGARPSAEYIEEHYPGWTLPETPPEATEETAAFGEGRYSHINFKPPSSVRKAFARAIRGAENGTLKIGSGMETGTRQWAAKFAKGQAASPEKIRKGYRFFKRNARFASFDHDTPAWAAWAFWGYSQGQGWFNKLYQQIQAADANYTEAVADFGGAGRYVSWRGFKIGIEYEVGSERFGRPMKIAYGYFTGIKGNDGEALDVYIGPSLSSDHIFRIFQPQVEIDDSGDKTKFTVIKDDDGRPVLDEYKYMICFDSAQLAQRAFKRQMPAAFCGEVEEVNMEEIVIQGDFGEGINLDDDGLTSDTITDLEPIMRSVAEDWFGDDLTGILGAETIKDG